MSETRPISAESEAEAEEGFRAAWGHLCQAWHALARPAARQMTQAAHLSAGMRAYLISNVALYTIAAAQFLAPIARLSSPAIDPLTTSPPALVIWGLTAAVVALAQVVALVWDGRALRMCAVLTAMWACAYGMALLFQALRHGLNFGGLVLWAWLVAQHFNMIRNQIAPADNDGSSGPTHADHPAEESELAVRLQVMLASDATTGEKEKE